jgi:sialate O-acetylesterase
MRTLSPAIVIGIILLCAASSAYAEDWRILFNLKGDWKFEIGDNAARAAANFDDSRWEVIHAPSAWENEGFPGYDGYAWYRKHFRSGSDWKSVNLALHLGAIDDVDEVYLNGRRIGSTGTFPPRYSTAYSVERIYRFSPEYLSPGGDNVIAVRVYDHELSGGILRGNLGVYEDHAALTPDVPLASGWKFTTGDDEKWSRPDFDDHAWRPITVPAFWEQEGFEEYDGFGWYRITFRVPANLADEKLILLLGKIDDFDETFLNGERIGKTGSMEARTKDIPGSDSYTQTRAYVIPTDLLNPSGVNVIAVRVYDGYRDGGIYAGPIGVITKDKYRRWQNKQKRSWDIFDWLFR